MQLPALRWSVLAVAIFTAAGCCYWAGTLERRALEHRRQLAVATADARALQGALSDTRRALAAMAAPGQAAVSWSRQATASMAVAKGKLGALALLPGGEGLAAHQERLDRLAEASTRLHDSAVGGRGLMASDIAFGEALPQVDAIDQQLAGAMASIATVAERAIASTRDRQILAFAAALGIVALAAVVLTPTPRSRSSLEAASETLTVRGADATGPVVDAVADSEARLQVENARVELTPLAAACDALACLSDGAKLPGALDAIRPSLGAKGLAVWLADAKGQTLQVVAASGYEARVVDRFPVLRATDDTPTSQAFARVAPVRTHHKPSQPASVAVPIAGARGVTGVLSFEMGQGREASPDIVAAATIVAAQLASLLEPAQPAVDTPAKEDAEVTAAEGPGPVAVHAERG